MTANSSFVRASIFAIASVTAVACSGASNQGSSNTQSAQPVAVASDNTPSATSSTAPSANVTGGSAFDASKQPAAATSASSASSDSQTPIGCALPEKIAKPLASQGQLTNTAQGSWANAGSAKNVASSKVGNLDLASCPWYRQAKAQGGAYYMISYTDPSTKQTYAQLSTSVDAIAFALCITSATAVGAICGFMP